MKFTADVETFAAQRRRALEEGFDTLAPAVEDALRAFGTDEWDEPILAAATEVWNRTQEAEGSDVRVAASFLSALAESLAMTSTPSDPPDEVQVRRIANWVAVYAINASTMAAAGAVEGEFVLLEWVTMGDEDVRDLHVPLNGVQVPVGERFQVGESELRYPGEPIGPPEVWINCRCLARPVVGEEMTAQTLAIETTDDPPVVEAEDGLTQVHGVLAPINSLSGDGRTLTEVTWADVPQALRWVKQDSGFHDGAVRVGTITNIYQEGDLIRWSGNMLNTPEANEVLNLMAEGPMGISVDLDSTTMEVDEDEVLEPGAMYEMRITGRIRAATLVDIPAFVEAYAAVGAEPTPEQAEQILATGHVTHRVVEGALMASAFTIYEETKVLPAEWFVDPELKMPTPVTVTREGRVFGHIAQWGVCHVGLGLSIGLDDTCTEAPHSPTNYAYYRTGVVDTDQGEIPVGNLTMGIGHAPDKASARATIAHYDNVNAVVADVVTGEDEFGIWFSGAMRPNLTDDQIRAFKGATLSGDWRTIGGELELVAALAVNVPGFGIPRLSLAASGGRQTALIAAGMVKRTEVNSRLNAGILFIPETLSFQDDDGKEMVKQFVTAVEGETKRRQQTRAAKAAFRAAERKRLTRR